MAHREYGIVRLLREELQLLQEPGSYVGEIVKVMGKNKVLVKVQPEGKYSACRTTYMSNVYHGSCTTSNPSRRL